MAALGTKDITGVQQRNLKPIIKGLVTTDQAKSVYFAKEQEWNDHLRSVDGRLGKMTDMIKNNRPKTPPPLPRNPPPTSSFGRFPNQRLRNACNFCGSEGHLARECRAKFGKNGQLNRNWQPRGPQRNFQSSGPRFERFRVPMYGLCMARVISL